MIKLIVFDWNGTIFSDTVASFAGDNYVFSMFGLKEISLKRYRETFTIPLEDFYNANGLKPEVFHKNEALVQKEFHKFYEERAKKCRSRAGAKNTLQFLKQSGVKSILWSNHTISGIEFQLKRLGLKSFFETVLANPDLKTGIRDKGTMLKEYLKEKGFGKEEVVIVGDAPEEAIFAKNNGMKSVALTGGAYSTARLKASKPDFLIHNLGQLIKTIQKLNK